MSGLKPTNGYGEQILLIDPSTRGASPWRPRSVGQGRPDRMILMGGARKL